MVVADVAPGGDPRRPRWVLALPVLAAVLAVAAGLAVARGSGSAESPAATTTTWPDAVAISSDAPRYATLDELVAAADVVVRGEVVATERGRWFGAGDGSTRLQSRLVTLQVDEVLAGEAPARTLLLEEEGWLEDGSPLVVDGAAPSQAGDAGIWFLVDGGDPEVGAYLVVNAQGRYLAGPDGSTLTGAAGDDPLVAELAGRGADALAAAVAAR